MSQNIKTLAQAALATILANHTEAVVTVIANGNTASAVRSSARGVSNLNDSGETGMTSGTVRMNADTIGVVAEGQEITVAGSPAWAMRVTVDPTAGICAIEYLLQKPK